jgi:MFS family permease
LCVLLRSITGTIFQTMECPAIFLTVPAAVFLGKLLGGFLADRFGWQRCTLSALLLSILLLSFAEDYVAAQVLGFFLFNMSMPVTLIALSNLMPRYPGTAFGLTAFVIASGALTAYFIPPDTGFFILSVCGTALLFYLGTIWYNRCD